MKLNKGYYIANVAGITVITNETNMHNFLVGNRICVSYDGKDHTRKVHDFPEDIGIVVKGYPFFYSDFEFVSSKEDLD